MAHSMHSSSFTRTGQICNQMPVISPRAMSLPHSTPSPPPPLTNELVELTLCLSLHSAQRARLKSDPMLTARLNVLSRSIVPAVTKVAVRFLPFVSLEEAAALGDLAVIEAMGQLALSLRGYRPLTYASRSPNFLTVAARFGHLAVIQWWFANKAKLNLFADTLDVLMEASRSGHVDILQWWHANGLSLEMHDAHKVWARASEGGHVAVLQFWRERELPPPLNDSDAMDLASRFGRVQVLQWWAGSGMPLEYSHRALVGAVRYKHYDVMEWWSSSGLRLVAEEISVTMVAAENLDFQALEWLENNQLLQVKFPILAGIFCTGDKACIEYCMARCRLVPKYLEPLSKVFVQLSSRGRPDMLQLAVEYGFALPKARTDLDQCLEGAARVGSVETLEWWLGYGAAAIAPNKSDFNRAVEAATANGHVHVLEWLVSRSYYPEAYSISLPAMQKAARAGHLNVLKRLAAMRTTTKLSEAVFLAAIENGHTAIVEWWLSPELGLSVPLISELVATRAAFLTAAKRGNLDGIKLWFAKSQVYLRTGRVPVSLVLSVLLAACEGKQLRFLKWWVCVNSVYDMDWIAEATEKASEMGSVEILDWLLDMNLLDKSVIYFGPVAALRAGNVHVLEWWKRTADEHQVQIRFVCTDPDAVLFDPSNKPAILRSSVWLVSQGTRIEASDSEFPRELVQVGNPALIEHLLCSSTFRLPTFSMFDEASKRGHVCMLEGWKQLCDRIIMSSFGNDPRAYSKEALKHATVGGFVQVLDWWKHASNLPLKLPYRSVEHMRASVPGLDGRVGKWWIDSGVLPETDPAGDDGEDEEDDDAVDDDDLMGLDLDPVANPLTDAWFSFSDSESD